MILDGRPAQMAKLCDATFGHRGDQIVAMASTSTMFRPVGSARFAREDEHSLG